MSKKDKHSIPPSCNTQKFIDNCYNNALKMKVIAEKTMTEARQQAIRIARDRATIQGMSLENRYLRDQVS